MQYTIGKLKVHLGRYRDDVLCRVEDIAVGYGLLHGVRVKRLPQLIEVAAPVELTETGEHTVARGGSETDNQILFGGAASDEASVLVEDVLQFIEGREHLLVNIVGVRAVNLVDKERHALVCEVLTGLLNGVLQFPELLNVHHDDAAFVFEGRDKGILVGGLHEHRLVDVHVKHHRIELVAELQTVNDKQNLVIDPLAVVPEVFELQGGPADDVTLAETCGVLEQERIDVLVVAVAFALCNNLVNQLLRSVEGCQLCTKLVDEIVRFALMVEKFLHPLNNAVAAEFLLGTRTDQPACFVLVLLFLNFPAVLLDRNGLVGVGHEVVIENFFLYHLL